MWCLAVYGAESTAVLCCCGTVATIKLMYRTVHVIQYRVCAHGARHQCTEGHYRTAVQYSLIKQFSVRCQHMYCSYTVTVHYSITDTIEDTILAAVCPLGYESCVTPQ